MGAAKTSPKGTGWKLKIARELRATTSVTAPWLAQALHMGSASSVRALLARTKLKISKSAASLFFQAARTAHRNFADELRGLARRSSGPARTISSFVVA